jgi:hypothetical protein
MTFPVNQSVAPVPVSQQPNARKGCSPGCKTVALGCAGMMLGSFITIAVEVALVAKGVSQVTDFFNQQARTGPRSPVNVEGGDPADLNVRGMRDLELSHQCGTSAEQTDPDVARLCKQLREDAEFQKRIERREKEAQAADE